MLKVTLKGIFAHKIRLATTALAVVLGVAFMTGTQVLTGTIRATFDSLVAGVNAGTDVSVRSATVIDTPLGKQRGQIPDSLLATVRGVDGVRAAAGDVQGYAQFVDSQGKAIGNPAQGAPTLGFSWTPDPKLNPLTLVAGQAPTGGDQVVMDKGTAKKGGFAVGDQVSVLTQAGTGRFTISGIVRYGSSDSPLGASLAVFDLPTAQKLLGTPGELSSISVSGDPGVSQAELASRVQAALPQGVEAITGQQLIGEQQSDISQQLGPLQTFMNVFVVIALVVGAFVIYNTFSIIVAQRTREMALLRAVGASRRQVLGSVVVEALATGLVASVLGVLGGVGLALGLRALSSAAGTGIPMDNLSVGAGVVISSIVVGVLVTVLSAVIPARRASKVPPVAAMRDVSIDTSASSRARLVLGAVVLVLGVAGLLVGALGSFDNRVLVVGVGALLTFVGVVVLGPAFVPPFARVLGVPMARRMTGRLARENAVRNPKRTAITAIALILGIALVGVIAILTSSIKTSIDHVVGRNFAGDFVLQSRAGFGGGLPTDLASKVADVPEVRATTPLRITTAEVDGSGVLLPAIDPTSFSRLVDVKVVAGSLEAVNQPGTIAVDQRRAASKGWKVGDTVDVVFPNTGTQHLTIAAIYDQQPLLEGFSQGARYFIGLPTYDANVSPQFDAAVFVKLTPGTSLVAGRAAIDPVIANSPNAKLLDKKEFVGAIAGQVDQITALIYVLLLFAVVIALFGIANTLALSVFERTRELGLMRAVGMSRRQLRRTIRWEAVIVAVLGTVVGLVLGVGFGWAVFRALGSGSFNQFSVPVGTLVAVVLLGALAGIGAAIFPARRASKMDVLKAVTTD